MCVCVVACVECVARLLCVVGVCIRVVYGWMCFCGVYVYLKYVLCRGSCGFTFCIVLQVWLRGELNLCKWLCMYVHVSVFVYMHTFCNALVVLSTLDAIGVKKLEYHTEYYNLHK